nr:hypothetical protein [Tanacetum cinerariifolium]
MNQNIDSSGFDQIQLSQYPVIHHPSQKMSGKVFQDKRNLMKSIQTFLEKFNRISFGKMPKEGPPQDSDIRQLVREECGIEVYEKQKKNMEDTILELLENLVQIPSEYEVTFDDESECDVPVKDESFLVFTTFSNPLFDCNDDFTSSDDGSLSDEDVSMENFKVYSNPLFDDEEINSDELNPHDFNTESDLIESLSKHDTFDYLEEISGELMPTSVVNEELDNFPSSLILVEDSDSLREEIDIFTGTDDLLPPGIESDDYDSEGDIHFLEELLSNDFIPLPENKSSNFDHHDDPSFPRPPSEPPDVEFFFDLEPNSGDLIAAVINNIDELNEDECFNPGGEIDVFENIEDDDYFPFVFFIRIFLPYLIFPEVFPLLLSTGSKDTIFDPGISV